MARQLEDDLEDDAQDGNDVYALFVLDASISNTVINKVFKDAFDECHFDHLWLAEDYDAIDVHCGQDPRRLDRNSVCTAVNNYWMSPWAGRDLQEVVQFVRNAPKPPKALNKVFFVTLDKEQYEIHECLMVCKIVDREVQSVPCVAYEITVFLCAHDRETWSQAVYAWQERGIPRMQ